MMAPSEVEEYQTKGYVIPSGFRLSTTELDEAISSSCRPKLSLEYSSRAWVISVIAKSR